MRKPIKLFTCLPLFVFAGTLGPVFAQTNDLNLPPPPPMPAAQSPAAAPAPRYAAVATAVPTPAITGPKVTVGGMVDAFYSYNFTNASNNVPGAGNGGAYFYSQADDSFALGMAEAVFTATQGEGSAHLTLADFPNGAVGGLSTPGLDVLQAYVSYNPGEWMFNAGRLVTWMGNEVIESKSNWNYTRSLSFQYAIPYWYEGISANYAPVSQFNLSGFVADGWNHSGDTAFYDWGKTYGLQANIKPNEEWGIVLNGIAGPGATAGSASAQGNARYSAEGIVTWSPTPEWSLAFDGLWGAQDLPDGGVTLKSADGSLSYLAYNLPYWTLDFYIRCQVQKDWALALRLEEVQDSFNLLHIYGAVAARDALDIEAREVAFTVEHNFTPNTLMRLEVRYDDALSGGSELIDTAGPFAAGSPSQVTGTAGAVFSF